MHIASDVVGSCEQIEICNVLGIDENVFGVAGFESLSHENQLTLIQVGKTLSGLLTTASVDDGLSERGDTGIGCDVESHWIVL
tara:strand:+ start:3587 stop:3835 length:249 start_codon:yes stop_codon:yes gene_type:complete